MTIELANRLCAYRKAQGLSQEELAARVGVTRQAVSKWERAEASPDTDNLIQLAKVYGVTLDALLNVEPSAAAEPMPEFEVEADPVCEPEEEHEPEPVVVEIAATDPQRQARQERVRRLYHIPIPVICVIAYLISGFTGWFGGWAWGWLVFLAVPLYYTMIEAMEQSDPHIFCYPVLTAWIFFWLGSRFGLWHPGWIVFLTVPVYYGIAEAIRK